MQDIEIFVATFHSRTLIHKLLVRMDLSQHDQHGPKRFYVCASWRCLRDVLCEWRWRTSCLMWRMRRRFVRAVRISIHPSVHLHRKMAGERCHFSCQFGVNTLAIRIVLQHVVGCGLVALSCSWTIVFICNIFFSLQFINKQLCESYSFQRTSSLT